MARDIIHKLAATWKLPRWRWALVIALVSDAVGFGVALVPPVQWAVDALTALMLFAVLGLRWTLLAALAVEAVPGLGLFPAWTLSVAALAGTDNSDYGPPKKKVGVIIGGEESGIERS